MATIINNATDTAPSLESSLVSRKIFFPILLTTMISLLMITAVGFAGTDVLHNAAHDVRHSLAFPCH